MPDIKFSIKLLESDAQIKKMILNALANDFDLAIRSAFKAILPRVQQKFLNFVLSSEEFDEIANGQLRGGLGIISYNAGSELINVIKVVSQYLAFGFDRLKRKIKVTLYLSNGWQDAALKSYKIISTENNFEVEWLHWLLESGGQQIVSDYYFQYREGIGRSSKGVMRRKKGTSWFVPNKFQGNREDNFITRLFDRFNDQLIAELPIILAEYNV